MAFFLYRGKRDATGGDNAEQRLAHHKVVVKLVNMANCLRKGYHVFMGNFFTSINLARELFNARTYVTRTMRRNWKGLPAGVKIQLKPVELAFFRQNNLSTCAFREKKTQKNPVILLSTNAKASETEVETRQRRV